MGMGYGSNFDIVIREEDVKKICPREWAKLDDLIDEWSSSWSDVAKAVHDSNEVEDVEDEGSQAIWVAVDTLQDNFESKTGIGLDLRYHDSNGEGSRYDEVDEHFWTLSWGDCYQFTPAFVKLREQGIDADLKTWVTYG